jgi:hypothetical protein
MRLPDLGRLRLRPACDAADAGDADAWSTGGRIRDDDNAFTPEFLRLVAPARAGGARPVTARGQPIHQLGKPIGPGGALANEYPFAHASPKIGIAESDIPGAGLGLFACEPLAPGEFVTMFTGVWSTEADLTKAMPDDVCVDAYSAAYRPFVTPYEPKQIDLDGRWRTNTSFHRLVCVPRMAAGATPFVEGERKLCALSVHPREVCDVGGLMNERKTTSEATCILQEAFVDHCEPDGRHTVRASMVVRVNPDMEGGVAAGQELTISYDQKEGGKDQAQGKGVRFDRRKYVSKLVHIVEALDLGDRVRTVDLGDGVLTKEVLGPPLYFVLFTTKGQGAPIGSDVDDDLDLARLVLVTGLLHTDTSAFTPLGVDRQKGPEQKRRIAYNERVQDATARVKADAATRLKSLRATILEGAYEPPTLFNALGGPTDSARAQAEARRVQELFENEADDVMSKIDYFRYATMDFCRRDADLRGYPRAHRARLTAAAAATAAAS